MFVMALSIDMSISLINRHRGGGGGGGGGEEEKEPGDDSTMLYFS